MKYNRLIIYLFICLFVCCKTKNKKKISIENENSISNTRRLKKTNVSIISNEKDSIIDNKIEHEYLSEMMFLNNNYPFFGEKSDLKYIIKETDSIKKIGDDCGYVLEDSYETWYYANCKIEVSDTEYVFMKIDFTISNFTLKHKEIIFSKNYTIEEFKEDFPISYLNNNAVEENGVKSFNLHDHPLADSIYIFKFKGDKLIEMHYFFPC